MSSTILLVEDEPTQQHLGARILTAKLGYHVELAGNGEEALAILRANQDIQLMLLDLGLPDMHGLELLERSVRAYPSVPVIILTGSTEINDAVRATKLGAADFINKPIHPERLQVSIANALKLSQLQHEVSRLAREHGNQTRFTDLIGHEEGLKEAVRIGRKAAQVEMPVFITGDTGTGKELFARAVHGESQRAGKPFIAVNCGGIPETLVESTLFGHEKGAFTGAVSKALGKFREAEGGTLFLDEIGELSLSAQAKLLRVLQQREVEPVGAGRPVPVDVRVISATHRDLAKDVKDGRFREDLFFRLNVLPLPLPLLRDRRADILPLARDCIVRFAATERLPMRKLSPSAEAMFMDYEWPGNVRELVNVLHRALVLCDGDLLEPQDFPSLSGYGQDISGERVRSVVRIEVIKADGAMKTMDEIEREAMRLAIEAHRRNITQAANALGIAKSTFYRKMKQYGLEG